MVAIQQIHQALAASLIYFYPISHFARTYGPLIDSGVNTFEHQDSISTGAMQVVTRANIDTVYSRAVIDLSSYDVLMTIPEIPDDRTHIFPFHDFYGNSFAAVGSFNNVSAGTWLLTLGEPGQRAIELSDDEDSSNCAGSITGQINFPTTYGSIFPRLLLLNEPDDNAVIKRIQQKLTLKEIPRMTKSNGRGSSQAPKLTTSLLNVDKISPGSYISPAAYNAANVSLLLDVAQRVISHNLPVSQEVVNNEVLRNLALAGARSNGEYIFPCGVDVGIVHQLVQASLNASLSDASNYGAPADESRTDWRWFEGLGDFGLNFNWRAQITLQGYLGIPTEQYLALIYTGGDSAIGAMSLGEDESFLWTFSRRFPLAKPGGFWSLTVYDEHGFLYPNEYDKFGLGDRSNLTYSNGDEVYPSGIRDGETETDTDGPFQILLQSVDKPPPANWTGNWIPTPAGDNVPFFINIRLYGPTEELVNGSYSFPVRTTIKSIVE